MRSRAFSPSPSRTSAGARDRGGLEEPGSPPRRGEAAPGPPRAPVGGAKDSEKHAGFDNNAGGASCADVLALIGEVQRVVKEKTGYSLEPEVRVTGER